MNLGTRRYRSAVREDRAATTRAAILQALAEQLAAAPSPEQLSMPAAAATAGVSVRTAYHHFPDQTARLTGLAAWAEERLGPLPPIAGVGDLPAHVRRAYARLRAQPHLARVLAVAGAADEVRTRRLRARRLEIAALLTGLGAPSDRTARAIAVISMLASPGDALPLLDVHDLSPDAAGDAAAEAVAAVIADLRAHRRATAEQGME